MSGRSDQWVALVGSLRWKTSGTQIAMIELLWGAIASIVDKQSLNTSRVAIQLSFVAPYHDHRRHDAYSELL